MEQFILMRAILNIDKIFDEIRQRGYNPTVQNKFLWSCFNGWVNNYFNNVDDNRITLEIFFDYYEKNPHLILNDHFHSNFLCVISIRQERCDRGFSSLSLKQYLEKYYFLKNIFKIKLQRAL